MCVCVCMCVCMCLCILAESGGDYNYMANFLSNLDGKDRFLLICYKRINEMEVFLLILTTEGFFSLV